MLVNLSSVLSEQHKTIKEDVLPDLKEFRKEGADYPIQIDTPPHLEISHLKNRELLIRGHVELILKAPCDRCLKETEVPLAIEIDKHVNLDDKDAVTTDELDEANYIDGYELDVDKLLYNEILIGWPMKILCCEDCKGVCSVCGQNLNEGTCDCEDTSLDPRMSVIRDLFNNFKEV